MNNGEQLYVSSKMQKNKAKNKSGCFRRRSEIRQIQLPFDVQNNWPAMTTVYNTQQPSKMLTTESRNVLIKWCNSNRSAKFPCQNLPEQVGLKELPCGSEIPQKRRATVLKRKWFAEELCDSCAVLKQAPLVIIGHVMLIVLPNPLSCFAIGLCLRLICSVIVQ